MPADPVVFASISGGVPREAPPDVKGGGRYGFGSHPALADGRNPWN